MSPSYEPLPSNDSEQDITQPQTSAPQKAGKQPITRTNLLFIILGFLVTAFVFYKAGQWSVSLLPSASVEQSSSIPIGDAKENESVPDDNLKNGSSSSASTIDETMPGKYSVG